MAIVSGNQGSRGGLLTFAVVASIAAVTFGVLAIYFYVDSSKANDVSTKLRTQYGKVIAEAQVGGSDVSELEAIKTEDPLGSGFVTSMRAFDVVVKQRDDLAATVAGPGTKWVDAMRAATATRKTAQEKVKVAETPALPDSLNGAVNALADKVVAQQTQLQQLQEQLATANKQVEDLNTEMAGARAAMDAQLAGIRAEANQALDEQKNYAGTKDAAVTQIQADFAAREKQVEDAQAQLNVQIQDLNKQVEKFRTQNQILVEKTASNRVNTADSLVRVADGQIIRVVNNTTCYINLGAGDQIAPGLTFQVYDRIEGVPPVGENSADENLPRGKASIEVVRVGAGSSECRIIRSQPGYNLIEGDLIANLVYDRNTKYSYFVYGNFDLDQNNIATPGDTEVVKRLVTQWGAALTDRIGVNTDFVVLGVEPTIPNFTREELEDPINAAKDAESRAQVDAYNNVLAQAKELNIPVLNQNRFLYYIGYFEQARR